MMRSPRLKFGSLILLLGIHINLMSFAEANVAPVAAATTSSSVSASGLPPPPSKSLAAGVYSEDGKKHVQAETITYMNNGKASANFHQPGSSSALEGGNVPAVASLKTTNNDIAYSGEEHSAPNMNEVNANGIGEMSKAMSGQKVSSFVDFPPFTKPISSETKYQRQRRSYPIPSHESSSSSRFRPDELEFHLEDDRDREAFLKLLPIIANNRLGSMMQNDELSPFLVKDDDAQDNSNDEGDGDEDAIDLGTFQRPVASPYWTPLLGRPTTRGLYGLGERTGHPLELGVGSRPSSLREEDDTDGEWLEDSLPSHGSHFKTRRSGGNTEFTFNPVKSHFRRYMRATPLKSGRGLEFMPSVGRFGSIIPSNRKRRATANGFASIKWM